MLATLPLFLLAAPQVALEHLVPIDATVNSQVGHGVAAEGDWLALGARFDPMAEPAGRLVAPDAAAGDAFGSSVSMDGSVLAVGAPSDGPTHEGALYVYERSGDAFVHVAKLAPAVPLAGERLGESVLVAGDWIFGGMHIGDDQPPHPGRGLVFRKVAGTWQPHQVLLASDGQVGDHFGFCYALSPAGDELFVGARNDDDLGPDTGSVYRFALVDDTWVEQQKIVPPVQLFHGYFGASLAMTESGTLFVGAPMKFGADPLGRVYAYEAGPGGAWTPSALVFAPQAFTGAHFGWSIAASGPWLLVGSPTDPLVAGPPSISDQGFSYLYERVPAFGPGWVHRDSLVPPHFDGAPLPGLEGPAMFGHAVAMVSPGAHGAGFLAIGAPNAPAAAPRSGFGSVFSHPSDRALGLIAGPQGLALHEGHDVVFELDGGGVANHSATLGSPTSAAPSLEGCVVVVVGSASGASPALPLGDLLLPLVLDAYTLVTLQFAGQSPFETLGVLAPTTSAATLVLAVPPGAPDELAGTTLHHAAVALDPATGAVVATSFARPLSLSH